MIIKTKTEREHFDFTKTEKKIKKGIKNINIKKKNYQQRKYKTNILNLP